MPPDRPLTILCVSSYEKGQEFLRTCKALGCRVLLLTVEKLRDGDWPRDAVDEIFFMPEELPLEHLIYTVSYMARSQRVDRIVALDEFDMENVSALREHMRIPGMGLTTVRYFRDKLAMRARAQEVGIRHQRECLASGREACSRGRPRARRGPHRCVDHRRHPSADGGSVPELFGAGRSWRRFPAARGAQPGDLDRCHDHRKRLIEGGQSRCF